MIETLKLNLIETSSLKFIPNGKDILIGTIHGELIYPNGDIIKIKNSSISDIANLNENDPFLFGILTRGGFFSIFDINGNQKESFSAHKKSNGGYSICSSKKLNNLIITGNGSGLIKVWDLRKKGPIIKKKLHSDYISGIEWIDYGTSFFSSSGDGLLNKWDIRKNSIIDSFEIDDEIVSFATVNYESIALACAGKQSFFLNYSNLNENPKKVILKDPIGIIKPYPFNNGYISITGNGFILEHSLIGEKRNFKLLKENYDLIDSSTILFDISDDGKFISIASVGFSPIVINLDDFLSNNNVNESFFNDLF